MINFKNIPSTWHKLIIDNQPDDLFGGDETAYLFEERALLLASDDDFVVLRETLPDEYLDFIKGNSNFKIVLLESSEPLIDLSETILIGDNLRLIKKEINEDYERGDLIIQAYMPDKKIDLVAAKLGLSVFGRDFFMDSFKKSDMQRICDKLQLNVIPSICINDIFDLNSYRVMDFIKEHKKIVIKPDVGAGGQNILTADLSIASGFPTPTRYPIIIQEYLSVRLEGSIQFVKASQNWNFFFCETFQKNMKFYGFKYPFLKGNNTELLDVTDKFLNYFVKKYGDDISSFGIDFIVSGDKMFFHDINPRSTAVTYIISLLYRLYGSAIKQNMEFMYFQVKCDRVSSYSSMLELFKESGLSHITKDRPEGFALLYPGMLKANILNVLLVSRGNRINEYYRNVSQIIDRKFA